MQIINPNHRNPSPQAAIEPPIWCAYLAELYDGEILDAEMEGLSVDETVDRVYDKAIIVAMGSNPSASSTPKVTVSEELKSKLPGSQIVGLHYGNMLDIRNLKPRWGGTDFSKYRAHNWQCLGELGRSHYGVVYTSFGCPFDCYYCNIRALYNGITFRDTQDVVDEIEDLASRGVKNLKIADELFALNEKHVTEICGAIKDFNLNIWAYARSDTVTYPMLKSMKRAGVNWLAYGFENSTISKGDPQKAVSMTKDIGINVLGNYIFGLPDDTLHSMMDTLDLARWLNCEWANFYCAMAYPGSRLYDDTPSERLPDKWEDYDQFSINAKPLGTKYVTPEQVLQFRDFAFDKYFNEEEYLRMIWKRFGGQAVEHIREMLKWQPRPLKV